MSDVACNADAFCDFLQQKVDDHPGIFMEVLRHETTAAINRLNLAGSKEGALTFNTDQWLWLVLMQRKQLVPDHGSIKALVLSSLIDGRIDIFEAARDHGMMPTTWEWVEAADSFDQGEQQLIELITTISSRQIREAAGCACLGIQRSPQAAGPQLFKRLFSPQSSKTLWLILDIGLKQSTAGALARQAMESFRKEPKLLFENDVDLLLSRLLSAYDGDPVVGLGTLKECVGELSRVELGHWCLAHGRQQAALEWVQPIRRLSPVFHRGAVVAALACLELGNAAAATKYCDFIEDPALILKIKTRIGQLTGNTALELQCLTDLHDQDPTDGSTFVQLLRVLERLDEFGIIKELCLKHQETFLHDKAVGDVMQRYLTL